MSLVIERHLICDGDDCGENFGVGDMSTWKSLSHVRDGAYLNGWTYKQGKDYCDSCTSGRTDI